MIWWKHLENLFLIMNSYLGACICEQMVYSYNWVMSLSHDMHFPVFMFSEIFLHADDLMIMLG